MSNNTLDDNTLRQKLMERARHRCALEEQCRSAVRQKLERWGATAADAAAMVERLVDEGYIDERRYARRYVESKVGAQRWGRRKVAAQLALKGVPREVADEALAALDDEACDAMLDELAAARARTLDLGLPADRARLMRYLAQRGFAPAEIRRAVGKLAHTGDE